MKHVVGDPEDPSTDVWFPTSQSASWADYEEQYDVFFNPLHPDPEARLMGIPPPPEDWVVPRKTCRPKPTAPPSSPVRERNTFHALTVLPPDASEHSPPESSHQSAPASSPSKTPEELMPPPPPCARSRSEKPAFLS